MPLISAPGSLNFNMPLDPEDSSRGLATEKAYGWLVCYHMLQAINTRVIVQPSRSHLYLASDNVNHSQNQVVILSVIHWERNGKRYSSR